MNAWSVRRRLDFLATWTKTLAPKVAQLLLHRDRGDQALVDGVETDIMDRPNCLVIPIKIGEGVIHTGPDDGPDDEDDEEVENVDWTHYGFNIDEIHIRIADYESGDKVTVTIRSEAGGAGKPGDIIVAFRQSYIQGDQMVFRPSGRNLINQVSLVKYQTTGNRNSRRVAVPRPTDYNLVMEMTKGDLAVKTTTTTDYDSTSDDGWAVEPVGGRHPMIRIRGTNALPVTEEAVQPEALPVVFPARPPSNIPADQTIMLGRSYVIDFGSPEFDDEGHLLPNQDDVVKYLKVPLMDNTSYRAVIKGTNQAHGAIHTAANVHFQLMHQAVARYWQGDDKNGEVVLNGSNAGTPADLYATWVFHSLNGHECRQLSFDVDQNSGTKDFRVEPKVTTMSAYKGVTRYNNGGRSRETVGINKRLCNNTTVKYPFDYPDHHYIRLTGDKGGRFTIQIQPISPQYNLPDPENPPENTLTRGYEWTSPGSDDHAADTQLARNTSIELSDITQASTAAGQITNGVMNFAGDQDWFQLKGVSNPLSCTYSVEGYDPDADGPQTAAGAMSLRIISPNKPGQRSGADPFGIVRNIRNGNNFTFSAPNRYRENSSDPTSTIIDAPPIYLQVYSPTESTGHYKLKLSNCSEIGNEFLDHDEFLPYTSTGTPPSSYGTLAPGQTVTGFIGYDNDYDAYRITLRDGYKYRITAAGSIEPTVDHPVYNCATQISELSPRPMRSKYIQVFIAGTTTGQTPNNARYAAVTSTLQADFHRQAVGQEYDYEDKNIAGGCLTFTADHSLNGDQGVYYLAIGHYNTGRDTLGKYRITIDRGVRTP